MESGSPHIGCHWLIGLAALLSLAGAGCGGDGQSGCSLDTDCPAGRYCSAGECTFDCTFDSDCPPGYRCSLRGHCERWCEQDEECGAGTHCEAGACVSECAADGDCAVDELCSDRGRCEPACSPTNGGVEACDGLDNDCDDATDEDWPELGAACANAACAEGRWVCAGDGDAVECDGPQPAADDATCDGLDDDCDGATDEDAVERACPLQAGVCAGSTEVCLGAAGWSGCDYGPAYTQDVDATCDGLDEDCDGQIDEDATYLLEPELDALAHDGLDNNCNGLVDEPGGVMVPVPNVAGTWIDVYESAVYENPDCTGNLYGQAGDDYPAAWPAVGDAQVELYACSLAGVVPGGYMSWYRADRACRAQGKRLCSRVEWQRSCNGGQSTVYPYGMIFVPGVCNDPFGGQGEPQAAGSRPACTAEERAYTYDMSGNLAEWVLEQDPDDPGYNSVGGYGYACTICRSHGVDCRACNPGDPDDEQNIKDLLICDIRDSSRSEFPPEMILPFFGARCCLDGP